MATRCNIIIKKGLNRQTIYHHYDGYPSGVGKELHKFILDNADRVMNASPLVFATELTAFSDEYETNEIVHGDIGYLYVVDLDKLETRCYNVRAWDIEDSEVDKMVLGKIKNTKDYNLIYVTDFVTKMEVVEKIFNLY